MLAIKIGNACWQFRENVFGKNVCILVDCKALAFNCVVCIFSITDLARFFCLVSLGFNDYPWEIVGKDFVNDLTKSSEFHVATIINYWLASEMARVMRNHR